MAKVVSWMGRQKFWRERLEVSRSTWCMNSFVCSFLQTKLFPRFSLAGVYTLIENHKKMSHCYKWFRMRQSDFNDSKWFEIIYNDSDWNWFKIIQNDLKWIKMILNDSDWFKLIQTDSEWFKMIWNDLKWFKIMQNNAKWLKMIQTDLKWPIMIQTGPNWFRMLKMIQNDSKLAKL